MSLCISINHLNLALNLKWNPPPPLSKYSSLTFNILAFFSIHVNFSSGNMTKSKIWAGEVSEIVFLNFYINMNLYLNFLYFLKRYCTVVLDDPVIMSRAAVNDWETLDLCLRFDGPLAEEEAGLLEACGRGFSSSEYVSLVTWLSSRLTHTQEPLITGDTLTH